MSGGRLDLGEALRELQGGYQGLHRVATAEDPDAYRRAFDEALGHVRGALYQIQRAVRTCARQEPGRPRVDAAAQWCAAETAAIDEDPPLRWTRAGDPDAPLPAGADTPLELLEQALASCEARYDRALTRWG